MLSDNDVINSSTLLVIMIFLN